VSKESTELQTLNDSSWDCHKEDWEMSNLSFAYFSCTPGWREVLQQTGFRELLRQLGSRAVQESLDDGDYSYLQVVQYIPSTTTYFWGDSLIPPPHTQSRCPGAELGGSPCGGGQSSLVRTDITTWQYYWKIPTQLVYDVLNFSSLYHNSTEIDGQKGSFFPMVAGLIERVGGMRYVPT